MELSFTSSTTYPYRYCAGYQHEVDALFTEYIKSNTHIHSHPTRACTQYFFRLSPHHYTEHFMVQQVSISGVILFYNRKNNSSAATNFSAKYIPHTVRTFFSTKCSTLHIQTTRVTVKAHIHTI